MQTILNTAVVNAISFIWSALGVVLVPALSILGISMALRIGLNMFKHTVHYEQTKLF